MLRRLIPRIIAGLAIGLTLPSLVLAGSSTVPVAGDLAPRGAKALVSSTPAPDTKLHLVIALERIKANELKQYAQDVINPASPVYQKFLTSQEVGVRFGASKADVDLVVQFAKANGLKVTKVWENRFFVSCDTTVAVAEKVFGTRIIGFEQEKSIQNVADEEPFFAPMSEPQVPSELGSVVKAVFGLSNGLRVQRADLGQNRKGGSLAPPKDPPGATSAFSGPLSPQQVSRVYNVEGIHNYGYAGAGEWIGIVSPTSHDWADINYFASYWGLSGYGLYVVSVDGGPTSNAGQFEACLDGEIIIGQARNANVVYFQSPNTGASLLNMYNWINYYNFPVLSNSWVWNESSLYSGSNAFFNSLELAVSQMATQGIAHYNASGDWTAKPDGTNFSVHYPTSSPNVTSVGGTDNLGDSGGYWASETAWNDAGGGYSSVFWRPSWQYGTGINTSGGVARQLPDISALSGSQPGYWVRAAGGWYKMWGTSAAAPLWAAVHTLLDNAKGSRNGNLNPWLYEVGRDLNAWTSGFVYHDMTAGNNGYPATAGHDKVSGWGSADFFKLFADRFYKPNLAPYNPGGNFKSPIMLYTTAGNLVEPTTIHEGLGYYMTAAVVNWSQIADSKAAWIQFLKNGGHVGWMYYGPWPNYWYLYYYDGPTTTFAAGNNTVGVFADQPNYVQEYYELDNTYTRAIKVFPRLVSMSMASSIKGGNTLPVTITFSSNLLAGRSISVISNNIAVIASKAFSPTGVSTYVANMPTSAVTANKKVKLTVKYGSMSTYAYTIVTP